MVDIVREAEEDLKQEKLDLLWNKWKHYLMAGCAGIVFGTAGITGYDAWEISVAEKATTQVLNIVKPELGSASDTAPLLDIVSELPSNQAALARFIAIGDLLRDGKIEQASAQLQEIESNNSTANVMRNLARIQLAAIYVSDVDKTSAEIADLLKPIFGAPDNSWYAQAKMNLALALAHKDNDYAQAAENLNHLLEKPNTPLAIRDQALKLRNLYVIKSQDQ